jgi:hypothetical protein
MPWFNHMKEHRPWETPKLSYNEQRRLEIEIEAKKLQLKTARSEVHSLLTQLNFMEKRLKAVKRSN